MLNKRTAVGLQVITIIASAPSHRTITAGSLASAAGVSLFYIESILKDAREFGLIQAIRGRGGLSVVSLNEWTVSLGRY
jgi:DNA-binding IscR family transcriptional regulator